MRNLVIVLLCVALGGCAIQRAQTAQDARAQMVGLSKEQVLACMGPPPSKAAEGATEVWSYLSGNGYQSTSVIANADGNFSATRTGNTINGNSSTFGTATGISTRRFCSVNVVMSAGYVSAVNYSGPTGGLLTAGEQCAYAVEACVKAR